MPIYSYRCTSCGNEFDVKQSFSDAPLKVCEECGGNLRKLFNSVGIVFKGSGFYHNDARSSSSALQAKPSHEASASSSESSSVSSSSASAPAPAASTPAASSTTPAPTAAAPAK